MNEIIIQENNTLSEEIEKQIVSIEKRIKKLKEQEEAMKAALLSAMEAKNLIKLETDKMVISYVAPTDRESFDSKKFKEDNPDLYDEYVKISPVKSSIRIKVKA